MALSKNIFRNTKVEFSEVDINTPFVQDFIKNESEIRKISVAEFTKIMEEGVAKLLANYTDNDRLYGEARKNVIESVMFKNMTVAPTDKTVTEGELKRMFGAIQANNRALFKVKDPITGKGIQLKIFLTPMPAFVKQPAYMKSVTTAAATANGEIIFNLNFCRQLIKYAQIKGLTARGSMYVSNGGDIPDSYAYIEFLILHEIYHIVHADHFHQTKTEGMTPTLQNYLGDYITNYELVKKGYPQIPIGLFSSHYNYDNYTSMHDMQVQIIKDFKDMDDEQKQNMDDQMDDHLDQDNQQTNKSEEGKERGEQKPSDSKDKGDEKGDKGEQGDSKDKGDKSDKGDKGDKGDDTDSDAGDDKGDGDGGESDDSSDGEPSDGGDSSSDGKPSDKKGEGKPSDSKGEPKPSDKSAEDRIEQAMKDTNKGDDMLDADARDKMTEEERQQILKDMANEAKEDKETENRNREKQKQEREARQKNNDINAPSKVYQPIPWQKLIKQMIPKSKVTEEESMTKIHRRTSGSMAMAKEGEAVAVKPGIIKGEESSQSMLFILDNSGSMSSVINSVNKDILQIIDKNKSMGINNFFIIKFDSQYDVYKVNLDMKGKKHTYQQFENNADIIAKADEAKLKPTLHKIEELFKESWGGGTEFPDKISKIVLALLDKNYNSVMFTDRDILSDSNMLSIKKIAIKAKKKPFSFNLILNNSSTYNAVKAKIGAYKYMSYLNF